MKKTILWALAVWLAGNMLCAQSLDEVLAMNYQARGGLEKMRAVKSLRIKGKAVLFAQGIEMPVVLLHRNPSLLRVESTFEGKVIVQATDGQIAWWIMPFQSPDAREMTREQGQFFREQADFENPLLAYVEKGYALELLGKEDLDGTPAFKLKLSKPGRPEISFYLDVENGLELKSVMGSKKGQAETIREIIYGDYRMVNGLLMPFLVENKTNGKTEAQLFIASIEVNPDIDKAIFIMPLPKTAGAKQ